MKSANKSSDFLQIKIYLLLYSPGGRGKEALEIGLTPYPVLCRLFRATQIFEVKEINFP